MQISRSPTCKHSPVRGAITSALLQLRNIADILELSFGLYLVCAFLASQPPEDEAGLLVSADFDEPPGRLWKPPDNTEEDEERDDLKSDGEPPPNGRRSFVDERQTTCPELAEPFRKNTIQNPYNSSQ